MRHRWLARLILPLCFVAVVGLVAWVSIRATAGSPGPRYGEEAIVALILMPSLLGYLLALPLLGRRLARLDTVELALFSALTAVLDLGMIVLSVAVVYPWISHWSPMKADQFFFYVIPFAPIVLSVLLAFAIANRWHARRVMRL